MDHPGRYAFTALVVLLDRAGVRSASEREQSDVGHREEVGVQTAFREDVVEVRACHYPVARCEGLQGNKFRVRDRGHHERRRSGGPLQEFCEHRKSDGDVVRIGHVLQVQRIMERSTCTTWVPGLPEMTKEPFAVPCVVTDDIHPVYLLSTLTCHEFSRFW